MSSCLRCDKRATRRGLCKSHYESARARIGFESMYVDAQPVRDHVSRLLGAGLGTRRIAELAGVNRNSLQWLMIGRSERGLGPSHQMRGDIAAKILAVELPEVTHHIAAGGQNVPAVGTARRLQALVAIGYTQQYLATRLNMTPGNAGRLFDLTRGGGYVVAATARRVETLFNELQLKPGPSDRARRHAQRRGWPPPLAWDEDGIDKPAASPDIGNAAPLSFTDRYSELRELGYRDDEIAVRLGIARESLERQLSRHGLKVAS